jgi:hypothetical protein
MFRHVLHRVGLGLSLPFRTPITLNRVGIIPRLGRGTVVNVLRAISPENFLSRILGRVLGGRLSFNFISSFLSLSIFLFKNAGLVVGFFILTEMLKLLKHPPTFSQRFTEYMRSERNPSMNPLILQSLSN